VTEARAHPPLWPIALGMWPLVTVLASAVLPEDHALPDRPRAWAALAGGLLALLVAILDFVRVRRTWLGALIVWGALSCLGLVDVILSNESHELDPVALSFFWPGLFIGPVLAVALLVRVVSLLAGGWARRPRRWRVEYEGSKVVFVRRS
jgi:hypothetical protein